MIIHRLCLWPVLVCMALTAPALSAETAGQRYVSCLRTANLDPGRALTLAREWSKAKGGAPADHCAAVSLVELKRYPEAATRLDALGRAPDMGALRPEIFDQAGDAWMMAGDPNKAVASFSNALTLSASDADLYADLARAQAMRKAWVFVRADRDE